MNDVIHAPAKTSRWLIPVLLGFLAAQAGLRLWLASHSHAISQDGVFYLESAKNLSVDPNKTLRTSWTHPGYPAAILLVHETFFGSSPSDPHAAWEHAGQAVAILSSLALLLGVWAFGRIILGDAWLALLGAMLFGLGRKFAALGADVLSDPLMLAFQVWSLVAALGVARALQARPLRAAFLAGLSGALAAAAYWVRPEGIVALPAAMALWLIPAARHRAGWGRTAISVVVAAVVAVLCMMPYIRLIGGLTLKWHISEFGLAVPTASGGIGLAIAPLYPTDNPSWLRVVGKFFEAQHPVVASLSVAYLLIWLASRWRRLAALRSCLPPVTAAGGWLILVVWLLILPPLILRYRATGAMSHRYLMLPASLMAPLAGATLVALIRLPFLRVPEPKARRLRRIVLAGATIALCAGLIAHGLRPLHEDQLYSKQAGLWLADHMKPGDGLFENDEIAGYYSQAHWRQRFREAGMPNILARHPEWTREQFIHNLLKNVLQAPGDAFAAVNGREGDKTTTELFPILHAFGFQRVTSIPYVRDGKPRPEKKSIFVFVLRKPPAATPAAK